MGARYIGEFYMVILTTISGVGDIEYKKKKEMDKKERGWWTNTSRPRSEKPLVSTHVCLLFPVKMPIFSRILVLDQKTKKKHHLGRLPSRSPPHH